MIKSKPLVIGVTGPFGSGKSTAASFFEKKGYRKIRLSEFLEKELLESGVKISREKLQNLGNSWREKFGPSILAKKAIEQSKSSGFQKIIIDGIRNIEEISVIRKNSNCVILGIVADRKIRFERVKKIKNREILNYEIFEKLDYRDLGITDSEKSGLQVAWCLALSDYFIDSNEGFEKFESDLESFLNKIK